MARSSDSFFLLALIKDKTFQAREIRRVIAFATLYLVLTTVLLGIFYNQMLGQLVSGASPMLFVSEDMRMINEQIPSLSSVLGTWILVMMAVNIVVTCLISMYIVRKLGQPLLAVKRALKELGDGKLNVSLRADDNSEFEDVVKAVDRAVASINKQIVAAKASFEQVEQMGGVAANSEQLESSLTDCKMALDFFIVADNEDDTEKAA